MSCELPNGAWSWIYTAERMITDYQEGQAENKVQHNADFTGIPRTGKNHTKKVIEEWGMGSDNLKTVFPHASKPGHLQEILQFMVPFGYFRERDASKELDTVRENLENAEYEEHELSHQDLEGFEFLSLDEKIEELQELIEEESNTTVKGRLRQALGKYEEINEYTEMWKQNIMKEKRVPKVIQDSYKFYDEEDEEHRYSLSTSFNMKVFTPISTSMPQGVEFPDFFIPYAIPVDDFKRYDFDESLRIIFGGRNYDQYRELFDKVVEVGDTEVVDLKAPDVQQGRPHVETVSFSDMEWEVLASEKDPTQVMDRFKMAWTQMFNKRGIICGSDFEWDLRSQLKEALLDDEVDCITLYTGFLQNTALKKLVMTHFMQTYESIIDGLSPSEERRIRKKFVVDFLESQLVIQRRTQFNKLTKQDKQFNKFMSDFIEQAGHINTDVWADAKPSTVNELLPANTEHSFITKIKKQDWEELFKGLDSDLKTACKNAFQNQDYNQFTKYGKGFVIITEGNVPDWKKPTNLQFDTDFLGSPTYGYRHITPRMTAMKPVPFSNDDPSFFTEEMGYKDAGRVIEFDEYVQTLMDKWHESDQPIINRKDKELEQKRKEEQEEQKEKKELIQQNVISELEKRVQDRQGVPGEDYDWRPILENIKEENNIEFGIRTLEQWTKDTRDRLKDEAMKEPEEKLDHRDIADELKRDLKFVFGAKSSDRKFNRAVDYIMDNYDTSESYARSIADKAVDKAMTDLEFEGVIDNSHNVQVEGESLEEQKENYKEIMGIDLDDSEEGSDQTTLDEEEGDGQENEPESSDTDGSQDPGEDEVAEAFGIPGSPWTCECGRRNSGQHSSCPRCDTHYQEVESE